MFVFNVKIPFKLTLRVWDTFLLEGDKILSAMAYCLLKLHRHQLYALGMDDILNFLQVSYKNYNILISSMILHVSNLGLFYIIFITQFYIYFNFMNFQSI